MLLERKAKASRRMWADADIKVEVGCTECAMRNAVVARAVYSAVFEAKVSRIRAVFLMAEMRYLIFAESCVVVLGAGQSIHVSHSSVRMVPHDDSLCLDLK